MSKALRRAVRTLILDVVQWEEVKEDVKEFRETIAAGDEDKMLVGVLWALWSILMVLENYNADPQLRRDIRKVLRGVK